MKVNSSSRAFSTDMEAAMRIGVMPTPRESPTDLIRVARLGGIESIWLGEHSHLPVPTTHAFAADTPEFYRRIPDPYITLTSIAVATNMIRLGTGISLPAEHNPLTLAKLLATLDERLQDLGAERMIVGMPLFRTGDAEPMLDAVAELIALAE